MRKRLFLDVPFFLAVVALAGIQPGVAVSPAAAQPVIYCGVPPVPPVGCATENAHCICNSKSRCQWFYDCTQNKTAAAGIAYFYPYMMRMEHENATPRPAPGSRY